MQAARDSPKMCVHHSRSPTRGSACGRMDKQNGVRPHSGILRSQRKEGGAETLHTREGPCGHNAERETPDAKNPTYYMIPCQRKVENRHFLPGKVKIPVLSLCKGGFAWSAPGPLAGGSSSWSFREKELDHRRLSWSAKNRGDEACWQKLIVVSRSIKPHQTGISSRTITFLSEVLGNNNRQGEQKENWVEVI